MLVEFGYDWVFASIRNYEKKISIVIQSIIYGQQHTSRRASGSLPG